MCSLTFTDFISASNKIALYRQYKAYPLFCVVRTQKSPRHSTGGSLIIALPPYCFVIVAVPDTPLILFHFGFPTGVKQKTNPITAVPVITIAQAIRKYIRYSFSFREIKNIPKNNASNVKSAPHRRTNNCGNSASMIDAKITPAKTNLERSRK
jgi:membrane protein DedA with SNARE-associated domain